MDRNEVYLQKGVDFTLEKIQISLAAARVNAKLTQEEVARKMHVSKQTIVNWENGKVIPKPAQFNMMCEIYCMPCNYIFLPKNIT